jgi:hypothetical protein
MNNTITHYNKIYILSNHEWSAIKEKRKTYVVLEGKFKPGDELILWRETEDQLSDESLKAKITYITSTESPCALSNEALGKDYSIISFNLV